MKPSVPEEISRASIRRVGVHVAGPLLGYGDIVLRPLMATNGLLMFGCSTAFLFSVIQHIWFRS